MEAEAVTVEAGAVRVEAGAVRVEATAVTVTVLEVVWVIVLLVQDAILVQPLGHWKSARARHEVERRRVPRRPCFNRDMTMIGCWWC